MYSSIFMFLKPLFNSPKNRAAKIETLFGLTKCCKQYFVDILQMPLTNHKLMF